MVLDLEPGNADAKAKLENVKTKIKVPCAPLLVSPCRCPNPDSTPHSAVAVQVAAEEKAAAEKAAKKAAATRAAGAAAKAAAASPPSTPAPPASAPP